MRRPVAIYPFGRNLLPLVRHFEALQDKYSVQTLIAPNGFSLFERDAGFICNCQELGLLVSDESGLHNKVWSELMLYKGFGNELVGSEMVVRVAEIACSLGKKVTYFDDKLEPIPNGLKKLSERYPNNIGFSIDGDSPLRDRRIRSDYASIKTPVILVGSLVEDGSSLEIIAGLTEQIRLMGLRPLVLTKYPIGFIVGFHCLRHIFLDLKLSEKEKIYQLNLLIQDYENTMTPDVILLEAPDPLMRYSNHEPNGFGILSYMLCQAIRPDSLVCSMPCDLVTGQFMQTISDDFIIRYGAPIDAVHVNNIIIDSADLLQSHEMSFVHIDQVKVQNQINKESNSSAIPIFNVLLDNAAMLWRHIYEQLIK